ncbi:hypothetical protein AAEX28_03085 [Lentisphaerota bacterium WC36G]|nr:hypothetical protein LJT99_05965 [Lentisphaerae bacterium WC36]
MDINLGNFSRKARTNFLQNFIKEEVQKKMLFIAFGLIGIFFIPTTILIFTTKYNSQYTFIFGFGFAPFIIITLTILYLIASKNIKKFIERHSKNGVFPYCFECGVPVKEEQLNCPLCHNSLK